MSAASAAIVIQRRQDWTPDSVVVFETVNTADYMVNIYVVFRGGGTQVTVRTKSFPGWPARIALPLAAASGRTLFLTRTPGRFKTTVIGANLAVADIEAIEIRGSEGAGDVLEIRNARVVDAMPAEFPLPDTPLVDELHQWRSRSWPGKAGGIESVRKSVAAELAAAEPDMPESWSAYGGWRGQCFEAGGFFRTEHDGRRWWLVDPDGHAFWSIGVDCVRSSNEVNVTGIENVFEPPLPPVREAPHLWATRGADERLFDAGAHNLERVLGEGWREQWYDLTRRRLRRYRFNTIANWSDRELQRRSRIPYVFTMDGWPATARMLFRDFPDVYAPEYESNCRAFARQLADIRDDPFVIGYFMTNEPKWAFVNGFDLGAQLLRDDRPSASLDAFIRRLGDRYGTVAALNRAWGSDLQSFEDLRQPWVPARFPGCTRDTEAFTAAAVERFVRLPAEACRAVDPNHLNLGLRWAWVHSDYQLAGCDQLDAFSINCYQLRPDADMVAELSRKTGKPIMIGEFHIGCLDRGLPSGGIRNTRTMAESVQAYRYYLEQAAAIPHLVGAHYFQWNDQHVMGRFDGENMQIGVHDITGRPYPEWVAMCRDIHPRLYDVAAGQRAPFADEPDTVPEGTLCW